MNSALIITLNFKGLEKQMLWDPFKEPLVLDPSALWVVQMMDSTITVRYLGDTEEKTVLNPLIKIKDEQIANNNAIRLTSQIKISFRHSNILSPPYQNPIRYSGGSLQHGLYVLKGVGKSIVEAYPSESFLVGYSRSKPVFTLKQDGSEYILTPLLLQVRLKYKHRPVIVGNIDTAIRIPAGDFYQCCIMWGKLWWRFSPAPLDLLRARGASSIKAFWKALIVLLVSLGFLVVFVGGLFLLAHKTPLQAPKTVEELPVVRFLSANKKLEPKIVPPPPPPPPVPKKREIEKKEPVVEAKKQQPPKAQLAAPPPPSKASIAPQKMITPKLSLPKKDKMPVVTKTAPPKAKLASQQIPPVQLKVRPKMAPVTVIKPPEVPSPAAREAAAAEALKKSQEQAKQAQMQKEKAKLKEFQDAFAGALSDLNVKDATDAPQGLKVSNNAFSQGIGKAAQGASSLNIDSKLQYKSKSSSNAATFAAEGLGSYNQVGKQNGLGAGSSGFVPLAVKKDIVVDQGLTEKEIGQVIYQHLRQIRYCHESALLSYPDAEGKLVVKFVVDPQGKVTSANVMSSVGNVKPIQACLLAQLKLWQFPRPKGGVSISATYPFVFKMLNVQ